MNGDEIMKKESDEDGNKVKRKASLARVYALFGIKIRLLSYVIRRGAVRTMRRRRARRCAE